MADHGKAQIPLGYSRFDTTLLVRCVDCVEKSVSSRAVDKLDTAKTCVERVSCRDVT